MFTDYEALGRVLSARAAFSGVPAMTPEAIARVRRLEAYQLAAFDIPLCTSHVFHAGVYSRTIRLGAGIQITGSMIQIPTMLMIGGDCYVTLGDEIRHVVGNAVIPCAAVRKSAFRAIADTSITMSFATSATTVEEAEAEFTDEAHLLASRRAGAVNICQTDSNFSICRNGEMA